VLDGYLLLGLRLGRHVDGFVDAYYGPSELAEQAEREGLVEPETLAVDAKRLAGETDDAWLLAQLAGCETTARRLAGEEISWEDEVTRCYGVRPEHTDESVFAASHERLDAVLPGDGDLGDRFRAWEETQVLPPERVLEAVERFQELLRARTRELVGLPDGEAAEVELVSNEPWSGFNYYLGGRRSRVVVNTDLPVHAHGLGSLVAHEIYPGHHAEHSWKETLLVDGEGRLEETLQLTGTPQAVISEGIAMLAPEIVDAHDVAPVVYAELGIDYDAATSDAVRSARENLRGVSVNAARMLHLDGASEEEVIDYLVRWQLAPREQATKSIEFLTHPTWRGYISSYSSGYTLCKQWVDGDADRFRRLLTERLSTHDLQA
jgi:phosphoglycolate phosphatase-like HAD superfamily hydrolase